MSDLDCIDCAAATYIDATGRDSVTDCIDCVVGINSTSSDLSRAVLVILGVSGSDHAFDCANRPGDTHHKRTTQAMPVSAVAATRCTRCERIGRPVAQPSDHVRHLNGRPVFCFCFADRALGAGRLVHTLADDAVDALIAANVFDVHADGAVNAGPGLFTTCHSAVFASDAVDALVSLEGAWQRNALAGCKGDAVSCRIRLPVAFTYVLMTYSVHSSLRVRSTHMPMSQSLPYDTVDAVVCLEAACNWNVLAGRTVGGRLAGPDRHPR